MKKVLSLVLLVVMSISICTACASKENPDKMTTSEKIAYYYKEVALAMKNQNVQLVRENLDLLNAIANDSQNNEVDRKSARCIYCFVCGIYKLEVSGRGISALQYPELIVLEQTIPPYLKDGQIVDLDETLSLAEEFLKYVNEDVN